MKILIVLFSIILAVSGCDYSQICADHTMCIYPEFGEKCYGRKYWGVTKNSDKEAVLSAHNRLRSKVAMGQETNGNPGPQPAAANMNKLIWDDELAAVAQRWVNQCSFGHDSCRKVSRFSVGQNAYRMGIKGSENDDEQDWDGVTQAWYDEVSKFDKNNISPFKHISGTGHYSQVVWADSKYIGCGFMAYKNNDGWYYKYYVCNYGPAGNIIGSTMYEVGNACSKCAEGCDNGLCL